MKKLSLYGKTPPVIFVFSKLYKVFFLGICTYIIEELDHDTHGRVLLLYNDHIMVEIFTRCLVKITPVVEKGFLTFYTRVHYGNVSPILTSEKRDEMKPCLA